nr:C39 family peptidase [Prosthecobacter dejongeii]
MDGEVLKTSRIGRDRSGFGKFQRSITGLVDQGIPVMWGVMLGLLPEPEIPQASGGHMRLIIGYNLKTNEFLYTDSWGAEHALKRMPIANAYTMTTGIYYMEPMK